MPHKTLGLDAVRAIALGFPGVEECTTARGTSFRVRGKIMACEAVHKSADRESIMVRIGLKRRTMLIDEDPKVFYVTSHYAKYPVCLVRLSLISRAALKEVLSDAWDFERQRAR